MAKRKRTKKDDLWLQSQKEAGYSWGEYMLCIKRSEALENKLPTDIDAYAGEAFMLGMKAQELGIDAVWDRTMLKHSKTKRKG